jgi:hypothetical protein
MKSVSELSKVNNNTMANDYWSLQLGFSRENETTESTMSITFRVTGEIDFEMTSSNDFDTANTILSPTIDLLQSASAAASIQLDFWELINWLYVSFYWTLLADLGQTSPTTHNPFSGTAEHYFSQAMKHPSTNNIFVNNSLFSQYSLYMTNTVMPLLGMPSVLTEFAPLTEQNQLEPVATTFARSYSCTLRTLRSPLTALVSVLVAEYAFLQGAYSLFLFVAGWYQKKRVRGGADPLGYTYILILANYCEMCDRYNSFEMSVLRRDSPKICGCEIHLEDRRSVKSSHI